MYICCHLRASGIFEYSNVPFIHYLYMHVSVCFYMGMYILNDKVTIYMYIKLPFIIFMVKVYACC